MSDKTLVVDLGGSVVAPDGPDTLFLKEIHRFFLRWLEEDLDRKLVCIVGGGGVARSYMNALKELQEAPDNKSLDRIGIAATHINAMLLKALFAEYVLDDIVTDYQDIEKITISGRVLMGAGWKPGFSTDYDAVLLAKRFGVSALLCLSNLKQIYNTDPRKDSEAQPIEQLTWEEYRQISGEEWNPGANIPFDPVATEEAMRIGLSLVFVDGRDLDNIGAYLSGGEFIGTTIASKGGEG